MKKFDTKKYPIYASFLNQLAKDLTRFYYAKLDKPFKITNKMKGKGYDPVTTSDKAFEKFIRSKISKKFPNHQIIGEEYGHKNTKSEFTWVIDPIDGTANYFRGLDQCCISIALMDKNEADEGGEKGVIINTASVAGYEGQIGQSAYSASKAGVIGLTITAARDLARHSIRVCTIAPGIFDTPLMQLAPDKIRDPLLESTQFPHRFGQPSEFGQLAAHIVENSYLNGETIRLDSGMRMKPR